MKGARLAYALVLVGAVLLLGVALLSSLVGSAETTFSVTASTERVAFTLLGESPSWWPLEDVEIQLADRDTSFAFSGFLEPSPGTDVVIERVGNGFLWIQLDGTGPSIGRLLKESEEVLLEAGPTLVVVADSFDVRSRLGQSTLIPLSGRVYLGREVGIETSLSTPVLRSGTIRMLGRSVFTRRVFQAGEATLGLGDAFEVLPAETETLPRDRESPMDAALGFVLVDDRPALSAAFRTVGRRGRVDRPGNSSFTISVSRFERIRRDPLVQAISVLLGAAAAIATVVGLGLMVTDARSTDVVAKDRPPATGNRRSVLAPPGGKVRPDAATVALIPVPSGDSDPEKQNDDAE